MFLSVTLPVVIGNHICIPDFVFLIGDCNKLVMTTTDIFHYLRILFNHVAGISTEKTYRMLLANPVPQTF